LVLVELLPFTATKSHSNDMTASDSALPREEPPMFRFTIRDVLWLTVVVAMGGGWCLHLRSVEAGKQNAIAELEAQKQKSIAAFERTLLFRTKLMNDQVERIRNAQHPSQKASPDEN
jgi:hypothetical protein